VTRCCSPSFTKESGKTRSLNLVYNDFLIVIRLSLIGYAHFCFDIKGKVPFRIYFNVGDCTVKGPK
jgi:hypothetical protein